MSKDDIESQVKKCREQLKDAQDFYWQSRFQEAEGLYKECLAQLDHIFPGYSPETATCLQGLGDTYYFQSRYLAAQENYKRLLSMRERLASQDPHGLVTALIKMAKTSEKLNEVEEAWRFYRRGLEVAQMSLFIGHPILTGLLESYLAFLKRSQSDSGMVEDIEKKLKLCRERYSEDELNKIMGSSDKNIAASIRSGTNIPQFSDEENEEVGVPEDHPLYEGKKKTNILVGYAWLIGSSVVIVGLLIAGIFVGANMGESGVLSALQANQKYSTIDSDKSITVGQNGTVLIDVAGHEKTVKYRTLSNPASGLIFAVSDFAGKQPLYIKTNYGLVDPSGMVLYAANASEWQTLNAMKRIATTIELYCKKFDKMPDRLEELIEFETKLEFVNPVSGMRNLPAVSSGTYGPDGNAEKVLQVLTQAKQFDTRKLDKKLIDLSLPKAVPPGAVLAICLEGDKTRPSAFFVVGADKSGQLFRNCKSNGALVLEGHLKGTSKFVCPLSAETTPSSEEAIIVSVRNSKRFASLLGMVIADIVMIVPLIIGWVFLQHYSGQTMIGHGTMSNKTKKIRTARWIFFPFVLLYALYTLLVLAEFFLGNIVPSL